MRFIKSILASLIFLFFIASIQAQTNIDTVQITPSLRDPIKSGALTLLSFFSTRFEPDSAFILDRNIVNLEYTVRIVNIGELSKNNLRAINGKNANYRQFEQDNSRIYSVYADLEYIERKMRIGYGIYDNLELEMTITDYSFQRSSNLDDAIKLTHDLLGNSNEVQDLLDDKGPPVYIVYDNQTDEIIFELTPKYIYSSPIFTFNLKWQFFKSRQHAISLNLKKDVGIAPFNLEKAYNKESKDGNKGYESMNFSINYTLLFDFMTVHAAYAETSGTNQFLPKSPKKMIYEFYGINIYSFFNIEIGFQFLKYSSPFPKDSSHIGEPIEEYTLGMTYWIAPNSNVTFGFLENNKQGPRNVDIGLLTNIKFAF